MATRYTYATGVSFGGDVPTAEFDVRLSYSFIPGRAETPPTYDHGGSPAEPAMIEDIEVVKIDGKSRPWDRCDGYVSDDELADAILNQLGDIDAELIAHAVETDASMQTLGGLLRGCAA
ncbi:hypothetical protein [Phenylobacterium sp. 58.2.17]|uniref:hypothetical protein n=1 Tax=Phenylobacterium sp. 58.2.17 TaxID=2969306 RepID=UPI002263F8ED|nr:hypothetical protein [Phenylobacterium sp. 58.2.17]MCX7585061.1 hypothetical protein [Phenylobacterium sp. 58.2.17]